jgi:hypothetical protein
MCEIEANVGALFEAALAAFLVVEADNICLGTSERNLCGRLQIALHERLGMHGFDHYFVDTEYNRKQLGQIKTILDEDMVVVTIVCDLIVHRRGAVVEDDNLLIIEMKKAGRPDHEKVTDRRRLRAMTKASFDGVWSKDGTAHPEHVCGYQLGVYVELDNDARQCLVEFYRSGEMTESRTQAF